MDTLVPYRMAKNWKTYAVMRQAASMPYMQHPDVLVLDQNPKNNQGSLSKHFLLGLGVVAIGVLVLFSFRLERRKKG